MIDRLYPPPGQAARFPIPIELTQEELRLRSRRPLCAAGDLSGRRGRRLRRFARAGQAAVLRNRPGQDAMQAADRLGRPMAILRMGSRVPMPDEDQGRFLYQQPPVTAIRAAASHRSEEGAGRAARSAAANGSPVAEFRAAYRRGSFARASGRRKSAGDVHRFTTGIRHDGLYERDVTGGLTAPARRLPSPCDFRSVYC